MENISSIRDKKVDESIINDLIKTAKKYLKNSYAPYSNIRVVAVTITDNGVFVGVNIENVSYGLTICAERVAIYKALSEGSRKFKLMLIYSPDLMPYPCGACRQVMAEFFDDNTPIVITNGEHVEIIPFKDLFPYKFRIKRQ